MFILSKKHFLPIESEVLTIDIEDSKLYVDASTYGQAYMLTAEHNSIVTLQPKFGLTSSVNKSKAIEKFNAEIPAPLNILAPFLLLVENLSEEECEDLEYLCGLIHKITKNIELSSFVKQAKEIRQGVKIFDRREYKKEWILLQRGWLDYSYVTGVIERYDEEVQTRGIPDLPTWDEIREEQKRLLPNLAEQMKLEAVAAARPDSVRNDGSPWDMVNKVLDSLLKLPELIVTRQPAMVPMGQMPVYSEMNSYSPASPVFEKESVVEEAKESDNAGLSAVDQGNGKLLVFEDDEDDDDLFDELFGDMDLESADGKEDGSTNDDASATVSEPIVEVKSEPAKPKDPLDAIRSIITDI